MGEKEFAIALDSGSTAAGQVTFHIQNTGVLPHGLTVIKTDTPAASLPTANGGVDTSGLQVIGSSPDFPTHAGGDLTVNLTPGHYALICSVTGHYAGGMHVDFTVGG